MLARTVPHPLIHIPASFPLGQRWYAIFTHVHAERVAGAKIQALGYEVLVPFEKRIQRRLGRKPRPYEAALFPRYGFVRFEINDERWGDILITDGVVDLIRTNGIPRAVPDTVIDGLKVAMSMGLFDRTVTPIFGGMVEATVGPFAGFVGRILRARTGDRVDVLFKILGAERVTTAALSTLREA